MLNIIHTYPLTNMEPLVTCSFVTNGSIKMKDGSVVPPTVSDEGIYFNIPGGPNIYLQEIIQYIGMKNYLTEPILTNKCNASIDWTGDIGSNPHSITGVRTTAGENHHVYRVNCNTGSFILECTEWLNIFGKISKKQYDEFMSDKEYVMYGPGIEFEVSSALSRVLKNHYKGTRFSESVEIMAEGDSNIVICNVDYAGPYKALSYIKQYDTTGTYVREL
jgi:hypothetical protein